MCFTCQCWDGFVLISGGALILFAIKTMMTMFLMAPIIPAVAILIGLAVILASIYAVILFLGDDCFIGNNLAFALAPLLAIPYFWVAWVISNFLLSGSSLRQCFK